MRTPMWAATVLLLALSLPWLHGHGQERSAEPGRQPPKAKADEPKPDPEKVKALMRRKLENSQQILEALALNDLDKAARHAGELLKIRKDPNFRIVKTPDYELWSDDFTRSADGLIRAAKEKNLEAGKLSYLGMTLACFNCHTYVRDLKRVKND